MLCFSLNSAFAGSKLLPVLNAPIADRSGLAGTPFTVNLNDAFGMEAIDDQVVRFTSQFSYPNGPTLQLDMALFSNRTPGTRANFLKYVADADYVGSFIHRSVPNFVIQGGGFRLTETNSLEAVPTDAPIANEFGVSNTLGTISMAKNADNPDSATSQWFVSLGENSDTLDPQNGGFTVFGRVTKSTFGFAQIFGNPSVFPIYDYGGAFGELPLLQPQNDLILFPTVGLAPLTDGDAGEDATLTYSVVGNSNPAVATVEIQPVGILAISPVAGQVGSTSVTVRATDSVGNTVDDAFTLAVNLTDTYATWATRVAFFDSLSAGLDNPDGDEWNNLQEFAFFGNPSTAEAKNQMIVAGITGTVPGARHLTLTFPVRKFTQGMTYFVEATDTLSGEWTEVWNSAEGFSHTQVLAARDEADRTVVTIQDTVDIGLQTKRFLRTRVVQQ